VELETLQPQIEQALKQNLDRAWIHRFLRVRLIWGKCQEDVIIPTEGRTRFPNISFNAILTPATGTLTDGVSLTLETAS
jgi:hypothetical protein